jgi:hypothetical protein
MFPNGEYKGTLEFRVFNTTLNPYFIYSIVELCKAFTSLSLQWGYKNFKEEDLLVENSIFDFTSKKKVYELLDQFVDYVNLDSPIVDILKRICVITPGFTLPNNYIYTHKRVETFWTDSIYKPIRITEEIKTPKYIDIHVLRGEIS